MKLEYTYEKALSASQRVNWKVEDIIGGEKRLDFSRRFLPESLAGTEALDFLSEEERRVLNQIRGHGYLCMFGLVEEFILPFVLDHARPQLSGDDHRTRALLQFATEEAKHIHLFKRFREEFEAGFGNRCDVIGPPEAVAEHVLGHAPLAVALAILHIEWMTQRHFVEAVRDDAGLDPQMKSLLHHHWLEEAQHAKLDMLMVEALAAASTAEEIAASVDGYLSIGSFLDEGLAQQVELDIEAFTRATGRELDEGEKDRVRRAQQRAQRWTFLGSGMTHPRFVASLEALGAEHARRVAEIAPAFC
jgi:predicted metal-dependent hydrolase